MARHVPPDMKAVPTTDQIRLGYYGLIDQENVDRKLERSLNGTYIYSLTASKRHHPNTVYATLKKDGIPQTIPIMFIKEGNGYMAKVFNINTNPSQLTSNTTPSNKWAFYGPFYSFTDYLQRIVQPDMRMPYRMG